MLLLSHPTGNQFVRNALEAFHGANILSEFLTGYAGFDSDLWHKWLKAFIKDFERREYPEKFKSKTISRPKDELMRLLIQRNTYLKQISNLDSYYTVDNNFNRHDLFVAKRIAISKRSLKLVYGYEDAASLTFKMAKENGIYSIYDLPIGYWKEGQSWQQSAANKQPYLRNTIRGLSEPEDKIEKKEKELQLANQIIVASNFTKSTLMGTPYYDKTIVIPYGFPEAVKQKKHLEEKKLKVLFVGGLTQRKGIGEVFDSLQPFKNQIDLTVIGQLTDYNNKEFIAKLKQHRWISSLPHSGILKEMDRHDVLLFPSWFEGFGLVISEAMSRGLPVITTPNTGANEFILNGVNGWLVKPGDTDEIKNILNLILTDKLILRDMSAAAIDTAIKRPWVFYQRDLANFITQIDVRI